MMVPRHPKRNHTTNTLPSGVKSDIQLPVIGLTAYDLLGTCSSTASQPLGFMNIELG
jgi:hypothetical protein